MIFLVRAPFLIVLTGIVAMLALSDRPGVPAMPSVAFLTVLGVMGTCFRTAMRGQWRVATFVLCVSLVFSTWIAFSLNRPPVVPSKVNTTGTVTEVRPWGRFYAVAVRTGQGGFLLKLPFATLTEGERIRLEGIPTPFRGADSKSDFREDRFWFARGLIAQVRSAKVESLPDRSWSLHRWRYRLYRSLALHMPQLTGAYLNASWTGKRDKELDGKHKQWGTSHLLSVSGFHVGIVMLGASLVFRRGKSRAFWLSLLLWFYVLLTGAPASAVRAGLMLQIALLGELAGRPGSPINSVSLAAILLLLYSPFLFWDIGWRLSIMAVFVIAAVLERADSDDWRVWLVISPMIWGVTFPQVTWAFGAVPVVGVLINFFASPFFGFALPFASFAAVLRLTGMPGADFLLYVSEGAFILWSNIADLLAYGIPWLAVWDPFPAYCCAGIFIALLCRALFVPWRNVAILAPLGSLAAFFLFAV